MGTQPDLAASFGSSGDAVAAALDLTEARVGGPALPAVSGTKPSVHSEVMRLAGAYDWWFGAMASPARMIEERLTWFWFDHFAVSLQKVRSADLVWRLQSTIRAHATGSFAEMLHAVAKDGAMLVYLDGLDNSARQRNENFAREVMELHTMGRDHYTQQDVVELARACTGWVVRTPRFPATERFAPSGTPDFASYFIARRHDDGVKTILGTTGRLDLDSALDVILAQPATARFIAAKLYRALVGLTPSDQTLARLATTFARDWSIMTLVHEIVDDPAFLGDTSVRTIVRSPVEKLVAIMQASGGATTVRPTVALAALNAAAYVPFFPPNPAGYPNASSLIGPQQLVHAFDLAGAVRGRRSLANRDVLARFGVFDATAQTRAVVANETDPALRVLLAIGSPEFALR